MPTDKKPSVTAADVGVGAKEEVASGKPPAVLQTPPTEALENLLPTQKPRDDSRRTDGGRSIPKVAPPAAERDDGKAVLTGELAAKVAKTAEKQAKDKKKVNENPIPDADRRVLDRQTPALAMDVLRRALDESGKPVAESYEATEPWVEADLSDDVGLNGRIFKAGRQWVPKAVVEAFPMVAREVKKDEKDKE